MTIRALGTALGAVLLAVSGISAAAPTFTNYVPPSTMGQSAGEPSIGVNPETGAVMYIASLETLKVTFDANNVASWSNVTGNLTGMMTLDPILHTDQGTGRTFAVQLLGATSAMEYTDDDGASWVPSTLGVSAGVDHQTLGAGPYPSAGVGGLLRTTNLTYPNAVYYCAQSIAAGFCMRSDNGGLTFGPSVPAYSLLDCGGLHGHVKVGGDGTVYLPNKDCLGAQGVAVSANAGASWTVRTVAGTSGSDLDPAVGVGKDGTLYMGMVNGDGRPMAAVSLNKGQSFSAPVDLGASVGVRQAVFPAAVAGDGNRAAIAFIGTSSTGDINSLDFPGVWYLYVSVTYDRGATWETVNVTPGNPVQREGGICVSGTTCGENRNLLDFIDMTIDAQGRVLVGYADGCIGSCATGGAASRAALATIARQSSGKTLYAAFD